VWKDIIAYGETQFTSGTIYTDKLFTGQREITGLGIHHYQACFLFALYLNNFYFFFRVKSGVRLISTAS